MFFNFLGRPGKGNRKSSIIFSPVRRGRVGIGSSLLPWDTPEKEKRSEKRKNHSKSDGLHLSQKKKGGGRT